MIQLVHDLLFNNYCWLLSEIWLTMSTIALLQINFYNIQALCIQCLPWDENWIE